MENANLIVGSSNLICGILIILLSLPLRHGRLKINWFYGVRTKKSFASEQNWYKINKYGADRMIRWSFALVAVGLISFFVPFGENDVLIAAFALAPPCFEIHRYSKQF